MWALRGINLSVKANERVALIGANGSGKSTLQLHLNGIILPQEGTVTIGEWFVTPENLREIRNFVGDRTVVLSQGEIVFDGKTEQVMSNPEFWSSTL